MNPKKRLGEMLIDAGVIGPTQLQAALGFQRQWGVRLGQALVDLKLASEAQIVEALARKFGFAVARIEALEPYGLEQALKLVPGEFALRNNVFPMAADTSSVTVAMSDPTNLSVVDELGFRTGRRVKIQIGGDREIAEAVKQHYPSVRTAVEAIALDLDADDAGEPVLDPFGGGSEDALDAFFGSGPDALAAPTPLTPSPAAAPPSAAPRPAATTSPAFPASRFGPSAARPVAAAGAPVQPVATHARTPAGPPVARPAATPARTPPAAPAAMPARTPPAAPAAAPARTAPAAPAATPGSTPGAAPTQRQAPTARPTPPTAPVDVGLELAADRGDARAPLLGEVPGDGFEEVEQEIPTPNGAEEAPGAVGAIPGEAVLATELAPEEERVEGRYPSRPLTDRELAILDELERLAGGAHADPAVVKPAQAMAALIRLLIKRRVITEQDFLDELLRNSARPG